MYQTLMVMLLFLYYLHFLSSSYNSISSILFYRVSMCRIVLLYRPGASRPCNIGSAGGSFFSSFHFFMCPYYIHYFHYFLLKLIRRGTHNSLADRCKIWLFITESCMWVNIGINLALVSIEYQKLFVMSVICCFI